MDDIVIEIKVRLSGLTYGQVRRMRDALRDPDDESMAAIVDELCALAQEVAPAADIGAFSPWAEWRPAVGRRQRPFLVPGNGPDARGKQ